MKVLVTGGAGSIGSAYARRLLGQGHDVRVMDVNEEGLWSIQTEFPKVDARLGDVQYLADCSDAVDGCDAIVHAAAYKHVHLCERSCDPAYRVNVRGTENMVRAANGRRFVFLSTDKATSDRSFMGLTKRTAQQRVSKLANTCYVQFGNVLGSRGSLIPAVLRYIQLGQSVKVTDPEMTRFFITIEEAMGQIDVALESDKRGLVPLPETRLRSAKIGQFLEICVNLFRPRHPIEIVGSRPGESRHECMEIEGGEVVCSDDQRYLMSESQIQDMIGRLPLDWDKIQLGIS